MLDQFTPGPWQVYGDDTDIFVGNLDSGNPDACGDTRQVCVVAQGGYEIPDYEEAAANAKLIAAAPDLLEALQCLVNIATHPKSTRADIQMIARDSRRAIRKALGG